MKGAFKQFFLIVALSFSAACGQVASQSQNTANDNRTGQANSSVSPKSELIIASNAKYGLSVVLRPWENEAGKKYHEYSIRDDKTNRELLIKFHEYAARAGGKNGEVWSPNGEYLVLNCGGICVYKTSETAKILKKSKSFQAEKYRGKTDIVTDKGNSEYEQEFVRWDGDDSFVLKAIRVKYDRTPNEKYEPQEYRYDAARRKLTCLSEYCGFTMGNNGRPIKIGRK